MIAAAFTLGALLGTLAALGRRARRRRPLPVYVVNHTR